MNDNQYRQFVYDFIVKTVNEDTFLRAKLDYKRFGEFATYNDFKNYQRRVVNQIDSNTLGLAYDIVHFIPQMSVASGESLGTHRAEGFYFLDGRFVVLEVR